MMYHVKIIRLIVILYSLKRESYLAIAQFARVLLRESTRDIIVLKSLDGSLRKMISRRCATSTREIGSCVITHVFVLLRVVDSGAGSANLSKESKEGEPI